MLGPIFLFAIAIPTIVLMLVWTVVTVYRLLMPDGSDFTVEESIARSTLLSDLRKRASFRQIRSSVSRGGIDHYEYDDKNQPGVPFSWFSDLDERKN